MRKLIITAIALFVGCSTSFAGAWGHRSFENDSALDWVNNFFKPDPMRGVEIAISDLADQKGYLQADECCYAIAAAESLAAARGKASADVPEEVLALAQKLPAKKVAALLPAAQKALEAILKKSELQELWTESGKYEAWQKSVLDLKARLTL